MFIIISIQELVSSSVNGDLYGFFAFSNKNSLEKKVVLGMDSLPSEWSSKQTYTLEEIQVIIADTNSDFYIKPL